MPNLQVHAFRATVFSFLLLCLFAGDSLAQTLRFDPDPYLAVDDSFAVPLRIEPGGLEVKGIEATITFEPSLVTLDSITPGPWYTGVSQDFFFWDYTIPFTYAIHFASAKLDGTSSDDGILAYCHFTIQDYGICDLEFDEWDVRDVDNNDLSFTADDGQIILDPAISTEPVRFNTLKAIYR